MNEIANLNRYYIYSITQAFIPGSGVHVPWSLPRTNEHEYYRTIIISKYKQKNHIKFVCLYLFFSSSVCTLI